MTLMRNTLLFMATTVAFFGWLAGCIWLGGTFGGLYGALAFGLPVFVGISVASAALMEVGAPFGGMPYLPQPVPAYTPPPPDRVVIGGLRESGPA